jgi:Phage phiEco32-like COOH.NH2 ligase-type 2
VITIGADPEFFIAKEGRFVSAHGLIDGTKSQPLPVDKGAVQVDGVALEFNVDPAKSYEEFQLNLDTVFNTLRGMIPEYDVIMDSAIVLSKEDFETIPKEVLRIGCSPDVNAYSEEDNPGPPEGTPIRGAGGHIHIGGIFQPNATQYRKWSDAMRLGRLMDKHVGIYSVLWDKDNLRRQVYGKAGALRPKTYGIEYRSLSNTWIFNRSLTEFVFDGTMEAVEALFRGEDVESRLYQGIINSGDAEHPFFKNNPVADFIRSVA